jgi:membrane anchored protein
MTKVLRGVIALVGATAILAVSAATAFPGNPYASGGVAGESTGGGGTLPFTGAELALYVVIGIAIVASGLALRAFSARRAS